MLHNALPALEALHHAWSTRATRSKYAEFSDTLSAGAAKISEYYEKTSVSDVYTMAMCVFQLIYSPISVCDRSQLLFY